MNASRALLPLAPLSSATLPAAVRPPAPVAAASPTATRPPAAPPSWLRFRVTGSPWKSTSRSAARISWRSSRPAPGLLRERRACAQCGCQNELRPSGTAASRELRVVLDGALDFATQIVGAGACEDGSTTTVGALKRAAVVTAIHGSLRRASCRSSGPMLTTFPPRRTLGNESRPLA